jgi:hypothetical protein
MSDSRMNRIVAAGDEQQRSLSSPNDESAGKWFVYDVFVCGIPQHSDAKYASPNALSHVS